MKAKLEMFSLSGGLPPGLLYEGPHWSAVQNTLWWVDIAKHLVFCRHEETRAVHSFLMPEKVSSVIESRGGHLIVTGQRCLWSLDPTTGSHSLLMELVAEPNGNRCNDAKCDPHGNLWFGTMDDGEKARTGRLWCLTTDGRLVSYFNGFGIINTLAWDMRRGRMYFGDSSVGTLFITDYRIADGLPELGAKEVFAGPDIAPGVPDGSAIDTDGNLWNARWDGGSVICIDPSGRLRRTVYLNASRPTSCAFVGKALDALAITTATIGLGQVDSDRDDGRIIGVDVGAVGQHVPQYGGSLSSLRASSFIAAGSLRI